MLLKVRILIIIGWWLVTGKSREEVQKMLAMLFLDLGAAPLNLFTL